jgi:hypothetical protein
LFNVKLGGIAAGAAFVLSLVIGIISGSGFLALIIRALFFAALFFGLSCLVFWLAAQFLPELLGETDDDLGIPVSGSRLDISVDGPITGAFPSDGSEKVDDIGGAPSTPRRSGASASAGPSAGPLDQNTNTRYNDDRGGSGGDGGPSAGFSAASGGEAAEPAEVLPDIDGLSGAVSPEGGGIDAGAASFDSEPRRPASSSRKSEMAGDFNPKELAQAIRTVLKKDEKG